MNNSAMIKPLELISRGAMAMMCTLAVAACTGVTAQADRSSSEFVLVEVTTVGVDLTSQSPVVLLTDPVSGRHLPIMVGLFEAQAIARRMEGVASPRPMTHDLLADMVRSLGGEVVEVVVHSLREGTYYGTIRISRNGTAETLDVDSRPSDAMALALRVGAPIRVARALLDDPPDIDFQPVQPGQVVTQAEPREVPAAPAVAPRPPLFAKAAV